ncbi:hypothetical protein V8E55_005155 [Tylopilus felleus]
MCMIGDLPCFDWFPCLSSPPNLDSFFLNLQTVVWYPDNHLTMLPFFRLLCGPALTSLSAEFATDPANLATVAALGTTCRNITDIYISSSGECCLAMLNDSIRIRLQYSSSSGPYILCSCHPTCIQCPIPAKRKLDKTEYLD